MSLRIVYAKDTGHVLGALTAAGAGGGALTAGGGPPDVKALVGDALPMSVTLLDGTLARLAIPAVQLVAAIVDDQPAALVAPLSFGVELLADGTPRSALRRLAPVPGSGAGDPGADGVTVSAAAEGVTVHIPDAATQVTPVLVVVSGADGVGSPVPGTIQSGERDALLRIRLATGDIGVLALVAGWQGRLDRVKVS
jgi:hypothetical protein